MSKADAWLEHYVEQVYAGIDGEQAKLSVGDVELVCRIASSQDARVQGLEGLMELPGDGMLFMYDRDHTAKFQSHTMSMDVSIWFFDSDGALVGHGWEDGVATADSPYRYVVETHADLQLEGVLQIHSLA